jgi:hypothetical protein
MSSSSGMWCEGGEARRRAALASLSANDAAVIARHTRECEYHGRCLSDPQSLRRCGECPLLYGELEEAEAL